MLQKVSDNIRGYVCIALGSLLIAETFHWFGIHTHYLARLAGVLLILWGIASSNLMPYITDLIDQIRAACKF